MSVYFNTAAPKALLDAFKKAIDDKHVDTWTYDAKGFFTHTPDQWNRKAFLYPTVEEKRLVMGVYKPQNQTVSYPVYAVYQGRFIESLITHCNQRFDLASATPKATNYDKL